MDITQEVEPMVEIKSVKLDDVKVAARIQRDKKASAFTAEQRARTILRERAAQRAQQSQTARFS